MRVSRPPVSPPAARAESSPDAALPSGAPALALDGIERHLPGGRVGLEVLERRAVPELARVARSLAAEPDAVAKLGRLAAAVGTSGFRPALREATPGVVRAVEAATGRPLVDARVVGATLERLPALVARVSPARAEAAAAACARASARLGLGGAATAGKAVPALGSALSVVSAVVAACALLRSLRAEPPDREAIAKDGVGALLQTAGVAFPWMGLAGDVVELAWSARRAAARAGPELEAQRAAAAEPELRRALADASALVARAEAGPSLGAALAGLSERAGEEVVDPAEDRAAIAALATEVAGALRQHARASPSPGPLAALASGWEGLLGVLRASSRRGAAARADAEQRLLERLVALAAETPSGSSGVGAGG